MRRVLAPLLLLLLGLVSLPTQAQALVFSLFPDLPWPMSEPAMLLVTGVVLVVLGSTGGRARQR